MVVTQTCKADVTVPVKKRTENKVFSVRFLFTYRKILG